MEHNKVVQPEHNEKDGETHVQNKQIDGGYGWATVVGGFFINFISAGILYSCGIIYVELLKEFKESKAYTSWVFSLMTALGSLAGPIASFFVKKYWCRVVAITGSLLCAISFLASSFAQNIFTLIITIGIGVGFGFGLIYLPAIVCVATYFDKYRALATGLSVSGSGVGLMLMAPLVTFLIQTYGWRCTMMVLSAIMLNCALCGALFRPLIPTTPQNYLLEQPDICKSEQNLDIESRNDDHAKQMEISSTNLCYSLLKDPIFIFFVLSDFSTCLGYYVPYFSIVDLAIDLGIAKGEASHLLSIIGIINTFSRIFLGYISDKPWANRLWVFNICLIICGVATALSVFCTNFKTLVIYSVVFGFTSGAYVTLQSVILTDLLGLEKLQSAFGLMLLFEGFATFIGNPIVAFLYDRTHSYTPGFIFAGTMIALSGLTLFTMPTLQRYVKRRQLRYESANDIAS